MCRRCAGFGTRPGSARDARSQPVAGPTRPWKFLARPGGDPSQAGFPRQARSGLTPSRPRSLAAVVCVGCRRSCAQYIADRAHGLDQLRLIPAVDVVAAVVAVSDTHLTLPANREV